MVRMQGILQLFQQLVKVGDAYDLSHPLSHEMPVFPFHAPFFLSMHRRHGDTVRPGGTSFASEVLSMPGHAGTHLDAIGHFSRDGKVFGGAAAESLEGPGGLTDLDADWSEPIIWKRGVLIDVAAARGVDVLESGEPISADDLQVTLESQGVALQEDDAVLVRTGWARHWGDPELYNGLHGGYPGLEDTAGRWLAGEQPSLVAGDTHAVEVSPPRNDSVHGILIADNGIPLMENLNLEELAQDEVYEFLFVAAPLRIRGGTGAPVRPVAIR